MKQAEEASFVDLIACERDCRIVQLRGGPRLRRQLRRLPPQRLLSLREPRRRPEQDGPAAHRAPPDPAPGSPGPELGGRVRHPRPGRADPVDLGASLTSRPRKRASPQLEALTQEPGFWDDQRGRPEGPARGRRPPLRDRHVARPRWPAPTTSWPRSSCWTRPPTPSSRPSSSATRPALETDFARERTALLFSGEYDERPALLSISAGAGGTEATDWAEMLLRMYLRWAERHRFQTEILDQQEGEQAGLKSVTVEVNGRARLRLAARRARRPPPRPDQPVRLAEPAPDDVRPRRGPARGRRRRRDRARLGRDPGRHVPLAGRRRPARQQDRLGRPPDPPADRHRRPEPERAVARPRTRRWRSRSSRRASSSGRSRRRRPRSASSRASTSRPAGATRSGATCCTPTRWSRTCGPSYETGNTGAVLDGDLDAFMQAELERGRPASEARRRGESTRARTAAVARPRGLDLPPGPGRRSSPTCAAIWRDVDQRLHRAGSNQPEIPPEIGPDHPPLRPPPGDRPGPVRRRDARPTDRATGSIGFARRPSASACGSSRCCSSCPRSRAPGLGRELLEPRRCPTDGGDGPRDRDRQRPADLERAVRRRTGSSRGCRCST